MRDSKRMPSLSVELSGARPVTSVHVARRHERVSQARAEVESAAAGQPFSEKIQRDVILIRAQAAARVEIAAAHPEYDAKPMELEPACSTERVQVRPKNHRPRASCTRSADSVVPASATNARSCGSMGRSFEHRGSGFFALGGVKGRLWDLSFSPFLMLLGEA